MVRWLLKSLTLLLAVGLVLAGLILVGNLAREHLRPRERYTLPFGDIDCLPPPGQSRAEFLDEVQYFASAPAALRLLDEDLPARLAEWFGRHPWVEKVEGVAIAAPRGVRVKLLYRTPVLSVRWAGSVHAVDAHGIRLPARAPTEGLPVYSGHAAGPAGPAGTPWGDVAVEEAARRLAKRS
jgi:hypothetical protein